MDKFKEIDGLQFIPVKSDKRPIPEEWQKTRKKYDYSKADGVGLVCGIISGGIEAIDFDTKYDLTGHLFDDYKRYVKSIDPELLKKMVVQRTQSGGYHFIYRCAEIEGNKKLARRKATPEESEKGEKIKVLIETRGEAGYIACYPMKGYDLVYGDFEHIQTITPEERQTLHTVAKSFNEVATEFKPKVHVEKKRINGLDVFEDYNNRSDVVSLLEKHGWCSVGLKGSKTFLRRPGDTKAKTSGNYDSDKNWFSVFSTSTEFDSETPYLPYAVYTILECNGDYSEAKKRLYDEGYGERRESVVDNITPTPTRIDVLDDDYSFLASEKDYKSDLDRIRSGTFDMGKETGLWNLNRFFRFKDGNLVIINGLDNVGKSTVIWYLLLLCAMYNRWKSLIFSSENSVVSIKRQLIEFYWGEKIEKMNDLKYREADEFIKEYFDIILSDKELYNYKDLMQLSRKAKKKKDYKALLIDPYNSLKIDINSKSKIGVSDFHYQALSELKLFGKTDDMAVFINAHAYTGAARQKDSNGNYEAPGKADTEQGSKFANKADDFLTIHRRIDDPNVWNITEIHVRKIKEIQTGGAITPKDCPIKIRMKYGLIGFEEFVLKKDKSEWWRDPVQEWHKERIKNSITPIDFTKETEFIENEINSRSDEEPVPF